MKPFSAIEMAHLVSGLGQITVIVRIGPLIGHRGQWSKLKWSDLSTTILIQKLGPTENIPVCGP